MSIKFPKYQMINKYYKMSHGQWVSCSENEYFKAFGLSIVDRVFTTSIDSSEVCIIRYCGCDMYKRVSVFEEV